MAEYTPPPEPPPLDREPPSAIRQLSTTESLRLSGDKVGLVLNETAQHEYNQAWLEALAGSTGLKVPLKIEIDTRGTALVVLLYLTGFAFIFAFGKKFFEQCAVHAADGFAHLLRLKRTDEKKEMEPLPRETLEEFKALIRLPICAFWDKIREADINWEIYTTVRILPPPSPNPSFHTGFQRSPRITPRYDADVMEFRLPANTQPSEHGDIFDKQFPEQLLLCAMVLSKMERRLDEHRTIRDSLDSPEQLAELYDVGDERPESDSMHFSPLDD